MVSASNIGSGFLVNLLSNDVARFDYGFIYFHFVWIFPMQLALSAYILYVNVGWAGVIGAFSLFIKTVPVHTRLGHTLSNLRFRVAVLTDKRVGIMNEIIQGVQVIKMYAWEIPFQRVVAEVRRREIKQIRFVSYARSVYLASEDIVERSSLFVTLAFAVYMSYRITPDAVFSASQIFNVLMVNNCRERKKSIV